MCISLLEQANTICENFGEGHQLGVKSSNSLPVNYVMEPAMMKSLGTVKLRD